MFSSAVGLPRGGEGEMRGVLIYWPMLKSPSGSLGLYSFEFEPNDAYPYELIQVAHDLLGEFSPIVKGNLAYHLLATDRMDEAQVVIEEMLRINPELTVERAAELASRWESVSPEERAARDANLQRAGLPQL